MVILCTTVIQKWRNPKSPFIPKLIVVNLIEMGQNATTDATVDGRPNGMTDDWSHTNLQPTKVRNNCTRIFANRRNK